MRCFFKDGVLSSGKVAFHPFRGDASKSVEMVSFHKGTNHFLVEINGTREADGFARQSLDVRSERQVITRNMLGEYLPGLMHLNRNPFGVTPQSSLVIKPIWKRESKLNK